jgi:hypothetical protein
MLMPGVSCRPGGRTRGLPVSTTGLAVHTGKNIRGVIVVD